MRIPMFLRRFVVVSCLPTLLLGGCHRSMYRINADSEAYCLIEEKVAPECWPIPGYTIDPNPNSRMFDPFDRDFPPMPPDDPTSHAYMHHIDCQEGYGCWHSNGDTQHVENPSWWQLLPRTETGAVAIDSESAMRLGLLHSPDYQTELEDLYLSALDVSLQRFQFDVQYFGGFSSFFTTTGRDRAGSGGSASNRFEINSFSGQNGNGNRLLATRLSASGAELAVGLANSLIWEVSGANTQMTSSILDFAITQPLLRNAGRDVVLEDLTQSERTLLANVRQMERYRREFYVEVIAGRNATGGPNRSGVALSSQLNGATNSSGASGGYLGLLEAQQDIRNQRANIAALQSSVAQLQAFFLADRIDYFQVELARQALYSAQSRLLAAERNLEASLDQFKLTLGLPPGIELALKESLIEPFQLVDPAIVPLQNQVTRLQHHVGQTLSKLYEQVTVPATERKTSEAREELPLPPEIRKLIEAKNEANKLVPAKNSPADADGLLDDPADKKDIPPSPTGIQSDSTNSAGGASRDDVEKNDTKELAGDKKSAPNVTGGPRLLWNESVASALQTLKQNIASARQAGQQAAQRNVELAGKDIKRLEGSLSKRNRDADLLRQQLLTRMREEQAERRLQQSSDSSDPTVLETNDADEVNEDDVNAVLPYREDRLKQLPNVLKDTIADILKEIARSDKELAKIAEAVDSLIEGGSQLSSAELFKRMQEQVFVSFPSELNNLAASVLSITLAQARARTESVSLPSVNLDWENAVSMAQCNRLDWMNARASIVDTWRQVQVTANDLESQLDVIVNGDIGNVGGNGVDFSPSTGRLRFGIEFDSPITRLAERNTYRESLISYQRARRDYYQFGDQVATSLRDILRRLRINQINFELQRAAVDVAISQVELARLRLQEPPKPGQQSTFGATTARDLVQALAGLLNAQNDFLSVWVSQEVLRRSLDLDLGTMQLDVNGLWIDPGARLGWNENRANRSSGLPDGMMEPLGDEVNDPEFDFESNPESIAPPLPDPPAVIMPLPDANARLLPPAVPLSPSALPTGLPTGLPSALPTQPNLFQPNPIQPVSYEQPILDADSAQPSGNR